MKLEFSAFAWLALGLSAPLALAAPPLAQDDAAAEQADPELQAYLDALEALPWVDGPASGELGRWAEVEVGQGMRFLGAEGARKYLELCGNPTDGSELGLVSSSDDVWFALFEFDESGYVEDDEKEELDADAILEGLREGQEQGNEIRRKSGLPTLEILGWMRPPHYDPDTNNLEWATRARSSDGGTSVNLNTRLLGRHGVMSATLVAAPEDLEAVLPAYREQLAGFSFKPGERYTEYVQGDRIAEYGLTGLIAGGVAVGLLKSGLLAKLWKPIAFGLVVLAGFAKKLFGRKRDAAPSRTVIADAPADGPQG